MRGINHITLVLVSISLLSGSTVRVVAQEVPGEAATPTVFLWTMTQTTGCGLPDVPYSYDLGDAGRESTRGLAWCLSLEADDPRVTGDYVRIDNTERFGSRRAGGPMGSLETFALRGVNVGGTWSGRGYHAAALTDDTPIGSVWHAMLAGEGDYEGLTLVLASPSAVGDSWGMIVPEDLVPPFPGPLLE